MGCNCRKIDEVVVAFSKIINVIRSCETMEQLDVAQHMIDQYGVVFSTDYERDIRMVKLRNEFKDQSEFLTKIEQ